MFSLSSGLKSARLSEWLGAEQAYCIFTMLATNTPLTRGKWARVILLKEHYSPDHNTGKICAKNNHFDNVPYCNGDSAIRRCILIATGWLRKGL